MAWLEPVTLHGSAVILEPLQREHEAALIDAVADGELWQLWYTKVPAPQEMAATIEARLRLQQAGSWLPFAVRERHSGKLLGMTAYLNVDADNRRLEIGATWYRQSAQRSAVNTECKLLLLTQAFEQLDAIAVEFRTHFLNRRSRQAIERLGARLDGVLRSHQILPDGSLRDTCVYSIVAAEWPTVRQHLRWRLVRG